MLMYDTEVVVGDTNHSAVPGYILHTSLFLCDRTYTRISEETIEEKNRQFNT